MEGGGASREESGGDGQWRPPGASGSRVVLCVGDRALRLSAPVRDDERFLVVGAQAADALKSAAGGVACCIVDGSPLDDGPPGVGDAGDHAEAVDPFALTRRVADDTDVDVVTLVVDESRVRQLLVTSFRTQSNTAHQAIRTLWVPTTSSRTARRADGR